MTIPDRCHEGGCALHTAGLLCVCMLLTMRRCWRSRTAVRVKRRAAGRQMQTSSAQSDQERCDDKRRTYITPLYEYNDVAPRQV
jgi:hypothetical protein